MQHRIVDKANGVDSTDSLTHSILSVPLPCCSAMCSFLSQQLFGRHIGRPVMSTGGYSSSALQITFTAAPLTANQGQQQSSVITNSQTNTVTTENGPTSSALTTNAARRQGARPAAVLTQLLSCSNSLDDDGGANTNTYKHRLIQRGEE